LNKKFGTIHYCANFLDKILSKSTRSPAYSLQALGTAINLLKGLDALQEQNPLVTLSFATDSLRVYYRGQLQFHIQARKHRTIIWIPGVFQIQAPSRFQSYNLSRAIKNQPGIFKAEGEDFSWVFSEQSVEWLIDYLWSHWEFSSDAETDIPVSHSRHIPGEVRQAVLTEFLASGKWCPGVAGVAKRHKVVESMRIEFDHILPHSVGGSNSYRNVQILCADCNQLKMATAT
jgi:hypothetical protein